VRRVLNIDRVLVFNDFPELFIAKDNSGLNYLCLLAKLFENGYEYLCISVSSELLHKFLTGKRDLRSIYVNPELKEWWTTNDTSESTFEVNLFSTELPDDELLPEAGYFYTDELDDDIIRKEVIDHNNVIIHLILSDNSNSQSIAIQDLGDFSKLYQVIIENSYKKAILNSGLKDKRSFIIPKNYLLRAFASSPGSFNLHLKSTSDKDLFGNSIIEEGLKKLDQIISNTENQEELIEILRSVKGHTINNYKKLLERIIDKNVTFKYKWVSPNKTEINTRTITTDYASEVKEILSLKDELTEEIKIFTGLVKQADVDRGNWRISNEEDGKDYSGTSSGQLLQGITLKTVRYKFTCKEVIEALRVTEKENVTYDLIDVEEL
jgi:hypothetical protein